MKHRILIGLIGTLAAALAGPHAVAAQSVEDKVARALTAFECAKITTAFGESGALTLIGRVAESADIQRLADAMSRIEGVGKVTLRIETFAWPYCEVDQVLQSYLQANRDANYQLRMASATGSNRFSEGSSLVLKLRTPNYASHIYVDYYQADGTVVHLMPNDLDADVERAPKTRFTIGDAAKGQREWVVYPPFGTEMMTVISTSKPLFPGPFTVAEDGKQYLPALKRALQRADGPDAPVLADFIRVTTQPKSDEKLVAGGVADARQKAEQERLQAEARRQEEEERRLAEARRNREEERELAEARRKEEEERLRAEALKKEEAERQRAEMTERQKAEEERLAAAEAQHAAEFEARLAAARERWRARSAERLAQAEADWQKDERELFAAAEANRRTAIKERLAASEAKWAAEAEERLAAAESEQQAAMAERLEAAELKLAEEAEEQRAAAEAEQQTATEERLAAAKSKWAEAAEEQLAAAEAEQRAAMEERLKAAKEKRAAEAEERLAAVQSEQQAAFAQRLEVAQAKSSEEAEGRLAAAEAEQQAASEERLAAAEAKWAKEAEGQLAAAEAAQQAATKERLAAAQAKWATEEQEQLAAADAQHRAAAKRRLAEAQAKWAAEEQARLADSKSQSIEEQKRLAEARAKREEQEADRLTAAKQRWAAEANARLAAVEEKWAAEEAARLAAAETERQTEADQRLAAEQAKWAAEAAVRLAAAKQEWQAQEAQNLVAEKQLADAEKQRLTAARTDDDEQQADRLAAEREKWRAEAAERLAAAEAEQRAAADKQLAAAVEKWAAELAERLAAAEAEQQAVGETRLAALKAKLAAEAAQRIAALQEQEKTSATSKEKPETEEQKTAPTKKEETEKVPVDESDVTGEEIVIGSHTALSGPAAPWGEAAANAMRMRFEQANEAGGIHGRTIRFVVEDNRFQPRRAAAATAKLIDEENIFAMVGALGGPMNSAALERQLEDNVPNLFPITAARELAELDPLTFTWGATYYDQIRAGVKHFVESKGKETVCVMYQETDLGQEVYDAVVEQLSEMDMEIASETSHAPTETDFAEAIEQHMEADCDLIAMGTVLRDTVLPIALAKEQDWEVDFLGSLASYYMLLGETEDGVAENFHAMANFEMPYEDADGPGLGEWAQAYAENYDVAPNSAAVMGWIAADLTVVALERAGPDLTVESLAAAIEGISGYASPFGGPKLDFSADDHQGSRQAFLAVVQDGRWVKASEQLTY